jgi:hypothetical protein
LKHWDPKWMVFAIGDRVAVIPNENVEAGQVATVRTFTGENSPPS